MGRVSIDLWRRSRGDLTAAEQQLATWAENRPEDVHLVFSTVSPLEDDEEQFESYDIADLCVEEQMEDGRIAVQCLQVYGPFGRPGYPEVWENLEKLARMGLERVKAEA